METTNGLSQFTAEHLDSLVADLNRDGLCILRGVFDKRLVEEWAAAFDRLFTERKQRAGGLAPREQARFYLTLPWVPPFADAGVFGFHHDAGEYSDMVKGGPGVPGRPAEKKPLTTGWDRSPWEALRAAGRPPKTPR